MKRKFIVILAGPSGSGKTTLEDALVRSKVTSRAIGFTTREPRPGEQDGVDVNFVSMETGKALCESDECVQRLHYNGHYYGKVVGDIEKAFTESDAISMVLEPSGIQQIRDYAATRNDVTVLAYYVTSSTKSLVERMLRRVHAEPSPDFAYMAKRMQSLLKEEIHWGSDPKHAFRSVLDNSMRDDIQINTQLIADDIARLSCAYIR